MFKVDRSSYYLSAISVLLGGILSWAMPNLTVSINSLNYWCLSFAALGSFLTCVIVLFYVPAIGKHCSIKYDQIVEINENITKQLDNIEKHSAEVIPRESIYPEMAKCIAKAKEQVIILTYYMYDWENNKRTFLPPEQQTNGKQEFYDAIFDCIRNPNIEYTRIWQVDDQYREKAYDVIINQDPLHKKELELIKQIQVAHPESARLIITGLHTTASFILIDKKHLFFNVDFFDKSRNIWLSPYMIFIKDATTMAFSGLYSIVIRITSKIEN